MFLFPDLFTRHSSVTPCAGLWPCNVHCSGFLLSSFLDVFKPVPFSSSQLPVLYHSSLSSGVCYSYLTYHVYMYTCTFVHMYMCTKYKCTCVHVYKCTCVHVHMYICTFVHIHVHLYTCTHVHVYKCTCTHVHLYMYICTHVHLYICTCVHVHFVKEKTPTFILQHITTTQGRLVTLS